MRTWFRDLAATQGRLGGAVVALAIGLILYLPLEPTLLSGLSGAPFWVLRLMPDALIGVAAAAVILSRESRRREALIVLWGLAIVACAVVALDGLRGFRPDTTINALRVLLRYPVLGAALLAVARDPKSIVRWMVGALLVAMLFQLAVAVAQFVYQLWPMATGSTPFSMPGLLGVGGTLGRYDRLGFMMVTGALLGLSGTVPGGAKFARLLVVAAIVGLAISSSRQAMVGFGAAGFLLALLPRLSISLRATRAAVACFAIAMVVLLPVPSAQQLADLETQQGKPTVAVETGGARSSLQMSLNPNRNFRLYYTLRILPWAAAQEPLLGFGPGEQSSETTSKLIHDRLEADGMAWEYARNYMNDSEYASLVIQFGLFLPALFFAFVGWLLFSLLRGLRADPGNTWLTFAIAYSAALMIGAGFGPAFEIRTVSIVLWVGLFVGLLAVRVSAADRKAVAP